MFNNKKDVLLESVKKVMQESELHRKLEAELNEAYGIVSRAALPHEYVAEYDAILAEAKKKGTLHPNQKVLDVAHPKGKLTADDFSELRAMKKDKHNKVGLEEGQQMGKGKPINTQNAPIGANLGGKRIGDKTGAVLGGKRSGDKTGAMTEKHLDEANEGGPDHQKMSDYQDKMRNKHHDNAVGIGSEHSEAAEEHRRASVFHQNALKSKDSSDIKAAARATARANAATKNAGGSLARTKLLDEKVNPYAVGMAAAEKATGDKPPLEKSTIDKAHKIAKAIMRKKMDKSLESIHEEIRNSLWEKLDYVYENYGEDAAMKMYASLTEEEQAILSEVTSIKSWGPPTGSDTTMGLGAHPEALAAARARESSTAPRTPVTRDQFSRSHAPTYGSTARAAAGNLFDKIQGQRSSGEGEGGSAQDTGTRTAPAAARPKFWTRSAGMLDADRQAQQKAWGVKAGSPRNDGVEADQTLGGPSKPAASAPAAAQPAASKPTPRPAPSSSGGSSGGQSSWAQKAFNPDTGT